MKILFVYPNNSTELRIPLAISILIAKLRQLGHTVKLFDSTFYGHFKSDNDLMIYAKKTNLNDLVGETSNVEPRTELSRVVSDFCPDFIFTSLVERNFKTAKELLGKHEVPTLIGGILPTIAPDFVSSQDWIDYICVGEGENQIESFLDNPSNLVGTKLPDLSEIPFQDWTDFDERHLLKPFMGKVYRGGAFEFSRGCFKSCSFCVAPAIRKKMEGCGTYHRTKSPIRAIQEIEQKKKDYKLNMIAFGDTDFLANVPRLVLREFFELYERYIGLPFTIQTSVEQLTDPDILDMLRTASCCAISVGVESGSDRIRKSIIHKSLPKELFKKAFRMCRDRNLRITANYMVGLPTETQEDVYETIKFNKELNPPSIAVTYFTPFMGTELYDTCIKDKLYEPFQENIYEYPPLKMPQLSQERIVKLVGEFTDDFKSFQRDIYIL